jgi:hypothetical protein
LGSILTASVKLFNENTSAWVAHLQALRGICLQVYKDNFAERIGLTEPTRQNLHKDRLVSNQDPAVAQDILCFRFLSGTTIWLDIISSITTGKAPVLLPYLSSILASDSQIKLGDIMGCKNCVMLQIGRIATQYEHKSRDKQTGQFDSIEFKQTTCDIKLEIERSLSQGAFADLDHPEQNSTDVPHTSPNPPIMQKLVTCVFAQMALVYLHLVTHGFQELESLGSDISETMGLLQTRVAKHVLPALISPLFIIGAVARQVDEQFFRDIFSSLPLLDPRLKHRGRILPILELIWERRQTALPFRWQDCLFFKLDRRQDPVTSGTGRSRLFW